MPELLLGARDTWGIGSLYSDVDEIPEDSAFNTILAINVDLGGSMTVIITGGAGFIGSHLCDAFLVKGEEVHVMDDLSAGLVGRLAEGVVALYNRLHGTVDAVLRLPMFTAPGRASQAKPVW
jgi:hypothetical protein